MATATRNRRVDVIDHAIGVLDEHGLAELSMRRLAADLGVRPSALYHHVANKEELLDLLAVPAERRDFAALEGGQRIAPGSQFPPPAPVFPRYVEPEAPVAGA